MCLPGKKGLPRGVSSGESAQGSVFLGVSAEEVRSAQGSGCVCVCLQMSSQGYLPKGSAQRVCLGVSHPRGGVCLGVSEYLLGGWGLSAWKVSVHEVSVSGWGFLHRRGVWPEACLPKGVSVQCRCLPGGCVCGSALGGLPRGVSSGGSAKKDI